MHRNNEGSPATSQALESTTNLRGPRIYKDIIEHPAEGDLPEVIRITGSDKDLPSCSTSLLMNMKVERLRLDVQASSHCLLLTLRKSCGVMKTVTLQTLMTRPTKILRMTPWMKMMKTFLLLSCLAGPTRLLAGMESSCRHSCLQSFCCFTGTFCALGTFNVSEIGRGCSHSLRLQLIH